MTDSVNSALLLRAEEQMNEFDRKAVFWQNFHIRTRVLILVLGVLTALCGVWHTWLPKTDETWRDWLRYGTIVLPALAVVLGAALTWMRTARRWVAYRAGGEMIKTESFLYATGCEKYGTPERDVTFERRLAEADILVQRLQKRHRG
jgi:hypothetical protein